MSADGHSMKLDASEWDAAFNKLAAIKEPLARRMLVSGGVLLRDRAKAKAARKSGVLAESIYLAFNEAGSTNTLFSYTVSWNSKKAPHGHLIEFGHWRYNIFANGKWQPSLLPGLTKGKGPQDHGGAGALQPPKWVRAYAFLRPTIDADSPAALQAMIERGRKELPILLAETSK